MPISRQLNQGEELTNQEVRDLFKCSLMGGMNRSIVTNSLVLINNKLKSIYQDRTIGEIIYYTGMGQEGDQSIHSAQNKTLNESNVNSVDVHLFEVLEESIYTYVGEIELAAEPFQEIQPDRNGLDRKVWMFPLKLKGDQKLNPIPSQKLKKLEQARSKSITNLPNSTLENRAKLAPKKPGSRDTTSKQYQRNEYVVELTKRRANGICELCNAPAPFKNSKGEPYLEVHHIVWLAKDGDDTIDNTVALCPNCHRKMHIVDSDEDKKKLLGHRQNF